MFMYSPIPLETVTCLDMQHKTTQLKNKTISFIGLKHFKRVSDLCTHTKLALLNTKSLVMNTSTHNAWVKLLPPVDCYGLKICIKITIL